MTHTHSRTIRSIVYLEPLEARDVPSFFPPVQYPVSGGEPAIADLNADGRRDVVIGGGQKLNVMLGNGDGTLQAAVKYDVSTNSAVWGATLSLTDLNADSRPDVAIVSVGGASVLLNNGDGTFNAPTFYPTGDNPYDVAAGDLNGDSKPDLAVANAGQHVSVLYGNGDGTFQPAPNLPTSSPVSVSIGDLDGDGIGDLVISSAAGKSLRTILSEGSDLTYSDTDFTYDNVLADLNRDGRLDVVAGHPYGTVSQWLNRGDGALKPKKDVDTGGTYAEFPAVADFNRDRRPDIALNHYANVQIGLALGNGDGTFKPPGLYGDFIGGDFVAAGDLNNDRYPDLVANSDFYGLAVLINDKLWPPPIPPVDTGRLEDSLNSQTSTLGEISRKETNYRGAELLNDVPKSNQGAQPAQIPRPPARSPSGGFDLFAGFAGTADLDPLD